jgi:hypothetical protein
VRQLPAGGQERQAARERLDIGADESGGVLTVVFPAGRRTDQDYGAHGWPA